MKSVFDSQDGKLDSLQRSDMLTAASSGGQAPAARLAAATVVAKAAARGEPRLNFPLAAYIHQPRLWEALECSNFGQITIKLRCERELSKVSGSSLRLVWWWQGRAAVCRLAWGPAESRSRPHRMALPMPTCVLSTAPLPLH